MTLSLIFIPNWGSDNKNCLDDNCNSDINNIVFNDTTFEFSFLKMENNKKNMLYSPLSIEYALNMLQEGADENTFTEINKVIGNSKLPKYASIDKNLSLANGLFIRDKYYEYVKAAYINILKEKYDAEVIKDEFRNAQNANKWIEDKTLGIIKNMLTDNMIKNPDNVMLIINALAIDMEWIIPFSGDNTYEGIFYLDNGQKLKVTMMLNKEVSNNAIAYYIDDNITVLKMDLKDYNGTQFEFMAIMPNEKLNNYVENVTNEKISQIDKNLKLSSDAPDGVNIKIPKFKFDYDLNLKQDLINLGIKDAFNKKNANFSKMSDAKERNKLFYVSEALHKADIKFSEKGVKAAAVTVFTMAELASARLIPKHPINIVINKPFMFIIRDKNTKDIWFTGTVYEPSSHGM